MRRLLAVLGVVLLLLGGVWIVSARRARRRFREFSRALDADLARLEQDEHLRPPLFRPKVEGTAREHYLAARRLYHRLGKGYAEALGQDLLDRATPEDDERARAGTSFSEFRLRTTRYFRPVVESLLRAASTDRHGVSPLLRIGIAPANPEEASRDLGSFLMRGANLVQDSAVLAAREGKPAEAVRLLRLLDRMGEDLACEPGTLYWSMGSSLRRRSADALADLAAAGLLPREERDGLERLLAGGRRKAPDFWAVRDGDCLMLQVTLRRWIGGELPDLEPPWTTRILHPGLGRIVEAVVRLREEYARVRAHRPGNDVASWENSRREWDERVPRSRTRESDLRTLLESLPGETPFEALAGLLAGFFHFDYHREWRERERHRTLLRLGLALLRHREDHGAWPHSIREILPEGVSAKTGDRTFTLHIDPETGRPSIHLDPPDETIPPQDRFPVFEVPPR